MAAVEGGTQGNWLRWPSCILGQSEFLLGKDIWCQGWAMCFLPVHSLLPQHLFFLLSGLLCLHQNLPSPPKPTHYKTTVWNNLNQCIYYLWRTLQEWPPTWKTATERHTLERHWYLMPKRYISLLYRAILYFKNRWEMCSLLFTFTHIH